MAFQSMNLVTPEMWENPSQEPQVPPFKTILKHKDHAILNGPVFVCFKTLA